MQNSKTLLLRNLIPKSYHFDGYNELKCSNSRDKPFFSDNVIEMGDYNLTTRLLSPTTLSLEFSSVCPKGKIIFNPFVLTLKDFVSRLKLAIQNRADFITFEITSVYCNQLDICNKCECKNSSCDYFTKNKPMRMYAAVSFNTSDIKEALAAYHEIINTSNGGKTTMNKTNKLFGMNFELGMSKDKNIASTLMGVAVKNKDSGNWYTFDTATNSRKNLLNFQMGNFPVFLLPTKVLAVGDLIKLNGKYYYVKAINESSINLIDAAEGVIVEMIPEDNIMLGITLYTKVVAFDTKTLTDPTSNQNMSGNILAAMYLMNMSKGNTDEFSLDSIDDSSFNGLGACLPLLMASGNNIGGMFADATGNLDIGKLLTFGSLGNGNMDETAQMLVISQLLGGNSLFGATSPAITAATAENNVVCPECKAEYPAGTNFCSKCGSKTKSLAASCKKCGTTLSKGAAFCHHCGAKVGNDTCPKCGKEVDDGAKFCSKCGHNLMASEAPESAEAPVTDKATTVAPDANKA